MDLVKLSPTHSYSKGSLGQEDLSLLHRPPAGEPCLSSLLHVFYLKPFHSLSSLRTYNLPVYLAVHTDQQDKGDHSVDDEVEVDDVDLTIVNILPQVRDSHSLLSRVFCAVMKDCLVGSTRQDTCLQLKEAWNVV